MVLKYILILNLRLCHSHETYTQTIASLFSSPHFHKSLEIASASVLDLSRLLTSNLGITKSFFISIIKIKKYQLTMLLYYLFHLKKVVEAKNELVR
jgi:hypothetical protein